MGISVFSQGGRRNLPKLNRDTVQYVSNKLHDRAWQREPPKSWRRELWDRGFGASRSQISISLSYTMAIIIGRSQKCSGSTKYCSFVLEDEWKDNDFPCWLQSLPFIVSSHPFVSPLSFLPSVWVVFRGCLPTYELPQAWAPGYQVFLRLGEWALPSSHSVAATHDKWLKEGGNESHELTN